MRGTAFLHILDIRGMTSDQGKPPLLPTFYHKRGCLSITEKNLSPQQRYDKTHTTRYQLKLNNITDKDIIDKLNTVPSKQGYIKECIRKDLAQK